MSIENQILSMEPELKEWFHYLHENPELGMQEYNTSKFVEEKLRSFSGIEVKRVGETGVVGTLRTGKPGRTLAFRADMDALPITETEDHILRSKNEGVMHACGHDGHTSTLLGTAKILSENRELLCGEIRFIFQPSEEIQPGGARLMVENGALDGVDYIFGFHYNIDKDPGNYIFQSGVSFASNYTFDAVIRGKGTHAAFPHWGNDTISAACDTVSAFNSIASRAIDPISSAVISVTQIHAGNSYNSIPPEVRFGGTIRFLQNECRDVILQKMEAVLAGITGVYGCEYELSVKECCPPLYNNPELEEEVKKIFAEQFGEDKVSECLPVMGCEDFAEYLKDTEGLYYLVCGRTVEEDGKVYPTHNSKFRLNEDALVYGVQGAVLTLMSFLEQKGENDD